LELKRWNPPAVYNGWERISRHDAARDAFNLEEVRDFMPQMGSMVGYAVTVVFEPSNPDHPRNNPNAWSEYRHYIASIPGPKVVIVQDLDKPMTYAAFWGEVNANMHRALGCVGTIIDGAIRDVDEMTNAGFKALARRLAVSHGYCTPVRWDCPVEVFGRKIDPNTLIHADKHGFIAIPKEDEPGLLDAARAMDAFECQTMIPAARDTSGCSSEQILRNIDDACDAFGRKVKDRFGAQKGEW